MTKEQLIKEFREKFQDLIPYQYVKGGTKLITTREEVIDFLLSTFDAGRASGIEEVKEIVGKEETTFGVSQSSSYDIGKNHGRQEFQLRIIEHISLLTP